MPGAAVVIVNPAARTVGDRSSLAEARRDGSRLRHGRRRPCRPRARATRRELARAAGLRPVARARRRVGGDGTRERGRERVLRRRPGDRGPSRDARRRPSAAPGATSCAPTGSPGARASARDHRRRARRGRSISAARRTSRTAEASDAPLPQHRLVRPDGRRRRAREPRRRSDWAARPRSSGRRSRPSRAGRTSGSRSRWTARARARRQQHDLANGRYFGGGMKIAPDAESGRRPVRRRSCSATSAGSTSRSTCTGSTAARSLRHPKASHRLARAISVETARPLPIEVDGELPGVTPVALRGGAGGAAPPRAHGLTRITTHRPRPRMTPIRRPHRSQPVRVERSVGRERHGTLPTG